MQSQDPFGWVGSIIDGQFAVHAIAGEGGFGIVYRGTHLGLEEPVAIKCLNLSTRLSHDEQESFIAKFRAEARLLHRLSRRTANIVQALDIGAATAPNGQWTPYVVMEWLEGETLEDDLDARRKAGGPPQGLDAAIRILTPAAEALGIAHRDNVSHLDVKPANLFLWRAGGNAGMKVLDFGIAKVFSETPSITLANAQTSERNRAFTPSYGAPEQFSLTYGATGPWTDVFAMALILIEVASGQRVLHGETLVDRFTASVHAERRPDLLLGVAADDSQIALILRRALAVNPAIRFQSMDALWSALDEALGIAPEPMGTTVSSGVHVGLPRPFLPPPAPSARPGVGTGSERALSPRDGPVPVDVFISYAPADDAQRARLEVHTGLMKRQGLIRTWHREMVVAGGEPAPESASRLDAARMVLLLVSADYLAHEACYERDMTRALARHAAGDARVIPIIIHACDWESAPFARLPPLPDRGKPVTSWRNRNEAWASVARGIRAAAEQIIDSAARHDERGSFAMRELGERDDLRAFRVASRSAPDLELAIDRDLIGRERELTDLLGQIDRGRALLWGPDGIGKTALARRIAEELAPHYGTCIEVDLMGASDEPLSPAAAMTLVLRALDREGEWTKDERILSRMYRSVLATKRPILILDDARDGAQVAPLVADGGYLVLITSRQPFTLPNLYARQLGQLDPADAIGLIQELAPHVSDKTASEIAMLCGYLPLALRVAAGAFAEVHGLDPFEYIDQLRAASGEVHSATRAMNASFGLLDQSTREFWCRLSVIPADFDDETASEVGGLGRSSAKSMMWKLWRYGLVEKNERLQQYRLHHLARAYARSRLAPIERQIAEGCSALWIAYNRDDWQGMWDALGNLVGIYESLDSTKLASRQQEELRLLYARQAQVAQAITKRSG